MKVTTAKQADPPGDRTAVTETADPETTYSINTTNNASGQAGKSGAITKVKKGAKPKLSAKERKERSVCDYSFWISKFSSPSSPRLQLRRLFLVCRLNSGVAIQFVLVFLVLLSP
jgi:hypothetical protein